MAVCDAQAAADRNTGVGSRDRLAETVCLGPMRQLHGSGRALNASLPSEMNDLTWIEAGILVRVSPWVADDPCSRFVIVNGGMGVAVYPQCHSLVAHQISPLICIRSIKMTACMRAFR